MIFKSYHLSWGSPVPYCYADSRASFRILYNERWSEETYFELFMLMGGWEQVRWHAEFRVTNGTLDEMEL